ncbi:MAG: TetR/AcrR family transcriptional regulator [Reyranella sp.]|uniref:TetR/AcrR family transcriptional regulator n=1 Tax=Reyranella sp. TaxID=1929291 RepID=UPI0012101761|nr:TetR/AcrR family transcriptional regulator [Reyranella sp.]TAJ37816.1 MAG: TetR/AcrR family transcriptional regulator [Reyranella sp.]
MEVEVLNRQVLSHPVVNGSRVARTREAIIASALALAETGDVAPIVRDIARMAGVSARTVFQHFADTAELYVAVLDRVFATGFGDMAEPGAASSLEGRVQLVVDRAADRYERLLPMWTFVETLQRRSPAAADMIAQVYATNQANLARWFDRELAGLPVEQRGRALNALALALAPESWVVLRQRLGLTVERARDELRFVMAAAFVGAAARR